VVHARLYRADEQPDDPPGRMICWLHGGPTDQWQVTFMPRVAYWRSRGYHVLVVDHRGSTGHGRAYQQALRGRWGELDVADVVAAVHEAHTRGWAAPSGTVLIGGSAGGFTVLGVLRDAPDLVAAAVVAYPVADLADLAERSHRFERHYTVSLVGDPADPAMADTYRMRSPVWFADRIATPLLVFHGDDDPVVPVGQSRLLVERMKASGADVELCVYPGEGHGFRQRHHQLDEYGRTEAFLSRHLR
jgi:dipeptidyl aminopeptidase/acylaminoacyl peptidase